MEQIEFIQKIIDLKKQNPDMDIRFCIDSGDVLDIHRWSYHKIYHVEIRPWYQTGEVIWTNEDDIRTAIADDLITNGYTDDESLIDFGYDRCEKAICIFTESTS